MRCRGEVRDAGVRAESQHPRKVFSGSSRPTGYIVRVGLREKDN